MDKIRQNFLWSVCHDKANVSCLVRWSQVCKPRSQEGPSVRDIRLFNIALISKWWWQFLIPNNLLPWRTLVHLNYYQYNHALDRILNPLQSVSLFSVG